MKKFLALLVVMLMVFSSSAFAAITITPTTKQCYEDTSGNSYCRVNGTIAMDSTYYCNSTTKICGYRFTAAQIGLKSITRFLPVMTHATNVGGSGGVVTWVYHSEGKVDAVGSSTETANIRAYYYAGPTASQSGGGLSAGPLVSAPSYDFSALTAVPFEVIGPAI